MSQPGSADPSNAEESMGWESLARAAVDLQVEEEESLVREILTFALDGDPYAVPVEWVREIVRLRVITPMPRVPPEISGVISLRGQIVQVLDLCRRLGIESREPTRATRVIVLHGDHGAVSGLLVDSVKEVLRITEDVIQPPPPGQSDFVEALCQHEAEFISLLNLERVLDVGSES